MSKRQKPGSWISTKKRTHQRRKRRSWCLRCPNPPCVSFISPLGFGFRSWVSVLGFGFGFWYSTAILPQCVEQRVSLGSRSCNNIHEITRTYMPTTCYNGCLSNGMFQLLIKLPQGYRLCQCEQLLLLLVVKTEKCRRAAYDLARTKVIRDIYRRAAVAHPDRCDWLPVTFLVR